ncbi:MAG: TIR domain-containing protein [Bacteroidota bacterium]
MSYKNKTYVIFDGDNDMWAYARMKGWKSLDNIDFDFSDAHDLKPLTSQAQSEVYIKQRLAERMANAKQVIVLIGGSTKNLYRFVRWELDKALSNELPIIAVNLNNKRSIDTDLCPPIIKNENAIHIPFRMKIIKYALDDFPPFHKTLDLSKKEDWHYKDLVYQSLDLTD